MESAIPDAISLLSELEPKIVRRLPAVLIKTVESSSSSPLGGNQTNCVLNLSRSDTSSAEEKYSKVFSQDINEVAIQAA